MHVRLLELVGVGYKASHDLQGRVLYLKIGLSHDIKILVPSCIRVFCLKPTLICCTGTDPQALSQFTAAVRAHKPPEAYKGKGIRYKHETGSLMLKQGKTK